MHRETTAIRHPDRPSSLLTRLRRTATAPMPAPCIDVLDADRNFPGDPGDAGSLTGGGSNGSAALGAGGGGYFGGGAGAAVQIAGSGGSGVRWRRRLRLSRRRYPACRRQRRHGHRRRLLRQRTNHRDLLVAPILQGHNGVMHNAQRTTPRSARSRTRIRQRLLRTSPRRCVGTTAEPPLAVRGEGQVIRAPCALART
jgi:hypothetical protein